MTIEKTRFLDAFRIVRSEGCDFEHYSNHIRTEFEDHPKNNADIIRTSHPTPFHISNTIPIQFDHHSNTIRHNLDTIPTPFQFQQTCGEQSGPAFVLNLEVQEDALKKAYSAVP
jgi:hypothetical protein